ncbi:hypothetical protein PM082_014244 [Marasmius tenuissimus]|nr:hypothetical protein PM082_014244 [Marasmius tenuissimus]
MLFAFPICSQRSQIVHTLAEPDIKTLLNPQLTRAINLPDDFYIHRIIPIMIIDTGLAQSSTQPDNHGTLALSGIPSIENEYPALQSNIGGPHYVLNDIERIAIRAFRNLPP